MFRKKRCKKGKVVSKLECQRFTHTGLHRDTSVDVSAKGLEMLFYCGVKYDTHHSLHHIGLEDLEKLIEMLSSAAAFIRNLREQGALKGVPEGELY